MSRVIKHILIAALFAVAMLGGGELPILHAPQFAEAHAFAHTHMHDLSGPAHHADAHDIAADDRAHDHDEDMPDSDPSCTHVHAHYCAPIAILVNGTPLLHSTDHAHLRRERNGALPYGQLAHPPLRPPRLTA